MSLAFRVGYAVVIVIELILGRANCTTYQSLHKHEMREEMVHNKHSNSLNAPGGMSLVHVSKIRKLKYRILCARTHHEDRTPGKGYQ